MEEEDDDFYAPDEHSLPQIPSTEPLDTHSRSEVTADPKPADGVKKEDELEEGEEEEEGVQEEESDSDIDIITDRRDAPSLEPPPTSTKLNNAKSIATRTASADVSTRGPKLQTPTIKTETPVKGTSPRSGSDYPAVATSTLDLNANPVFEPAGKPIMEVDMDKDFSENEAPWRVPRSDPTDWFNYGFDEYTWSSYRLKQNTLRESNQKERLDNLLPNAMPPIPGMPSLSIPPGGSQPPIGMPPMQGFNDIPPEMQAMMAQMVSQGGDISQMDPAAFFQQMQQMQQGSSAQGNGPSNANQAQGYMGGGPAYGQQGQAQQQMGFGYDPAAMAGGDGRNRGGNFAGRGRGGNRRNW
ncbi:MAG: hypothetical protein M1812_000670 [Candelaria pacifica]|nr:MAG: hypothetical protein M1812_000670 [Candelaria pacifica]